MEAEDILFFAMAVLGALTIYMEVMDIKKKNPNLTEEEAEALESCGCFCRCPECDNVLNTDSEYEDDGDVVTYVCSKCSHNSMWLFGAPVPILLD